MRALTVFGCTIKGDRLLVPAMKETLEGWEAECGSHVRSLLQITSRYVNSNNRETNRLEHSLDFEIYIRNGYDLLLFSRGKHLIKQFGYHAWKHMELYICDFCASQLFFCLREEISRLFASRLVRWCFVCISEQTAIISLYRINWLVFIRNI
jgi:hypothetical protein